MFAAVRRLLSSRDTPGCEGWNSPADVSPVPAHPDQFAGLVQGMRKAYELGLLEQVWLTRGGLLTVADEADMSQPVWYWFNAYAALAGLRLRKLPGFELNAFCGYADQATDYRDAEQGKTTAEIKRMYFGPR
jgi:hypothetical protein